MILLGQLWLANAAPDPERVRRQLAEVLKRPEFQDVHPNAWLQAFLNALARFFEMLGGLRQSNPPLFYLLLITCIVLLALLIGHLAWSLYRVFFVAGSNAEREGAARRARLSAEHARLAHQAADQEQYTEAIRHLFLSLVYRFDESGKVQFQRGYTNREYLELFAQRRELHQPLQEFVATLDQDWYGERPTQRGQYERCRQFFDSLKV